MSYETLILTKDEGIGTITLNRPERLNAIIPTMSAEIGQAIAEMADDPEVRVVVLTGAGKAFCAGADLSGGTTTDETSWEVRQRIVRSGRRTPLAIRKMAKPAIAAVNGAAAGGGCNLALACDIIIASENARFGETYVRVGISPDWAGTFLLPRLVGVSRACELIFTGKMIDAREAERIGLVNHVVAPEELASFTRQLALSIAKGPPAAIAMAKAAIYDGLSVDMDTAVNIEANAMAITRTTDDCREARKAWAEKREPQFKGR